MTLSARKREPISGKMEQQLVWLCWQAKICTSPAPATRERERPFLIVQPFCLARQTDHKD